MWGFPAAFFFSAVVLPVAAVFFYKRKSKDVVVPAVQIWEELGRPVETSSWATLLKRLLALLVQVLLVMLLVLALADPSPEKPTANRTVIVIDVSATMQTSEADGRTRFDLAKKRAAAALEDVPPDAEVIVLAASYAPVLAQAPTRDPKAARECIQTLEVADVEGDLLKAARSAASFIDPRYPADVVVLSDFAAQDPAQLRAGWNSTAKLRLVGVGRDRPNAAVTNLRADPDEAAPGSTRVAATVAQRGLDGRGLQVNLLVDGKTVATQTVALAKEPVEVAFVHAVPPGAVYEVQLDGAAVGDALAADDRAAGVLPRRDRMSICLVTDGNPFLERALVADPGVRLRIVAPAAFRGAEGDTVVIVDNATLTKQEPGAGGAAGYLFVHCADPFGWATVEGEVPLAGVSHWLGDHPAMAEIDPTLFKVRRGLAAKWAVPATEVVGAYDRTAIAAVERAVAGPGSTPPPAGPVPAPPDGAPAAARDARTVRALYWLFDVDSSDITRRISFPLLLWNAVDYLVDGGAEPPKPMWLTGRPVRIRPGAGAPPSSAPATAEAEAGEKPPAIVDPAGRPVAVRRTSDGWAFSDTRRQGVYRRTDVAGEAYAVNLLSPRGTRALPEVTEPAAEEGPRQVRRSWLGLPLRFSWGWIVLAAACLAGVEWVLFTRGWIRIG